MRSGRRVSFVSGGAALGAGEDGAARRFYPGGFIRRDAAPPEREGESEATLSAPRLFEQTGLDLAPSRPFPAPAPPPEPRPRPRSESVRNAKAAAPAPTGELRVIGEALGLYILVQHEGALVIIDKHAAHERMLYDALMSRDAPVHSQALLAPEDASPLRRGRRLAGRERRSPLRPGL